MIKNKKIKRAHLIGICGKGMSGLAFLLKQKAFVVSGSDQAFYDPIASLLKKNGINFTPVYSPLNIPIDADLIVIGKHANLIPEENEEVKAAFMSGIKIQSLPETLGKLAEKTENTIVAGSFGKSTMTALLAWCLETSNKDPSYFIGAVPFGFKTNAKLGKGKHFIFEGDEYPSSNWDKRSKFLHLHPKNLILISAEHDHINVFQSEKDYIRPYKELVSLLPKDGILVVSREGKNIEKVVKNAKCRIVNYGFDEKSTWYPENIIYGEKTSFDLFKNKNKIINLETILLGNHNIENIVGAGAFLLEKKLITPKEFRKTVKSFRGLSGRIDLKTKKSSVLVYEGFGSSYAKAKSVFDAIKLHFPNKNLITVFEPHTFSWRNTETKKWYKDIFNTSSKVIMLPSPLSDEKTPNQMNFSEIIKEARKNRTDILVAKNEKSALALLKKIVKKDDIVVLISSGSLLGLTVSVPKLMEKMFPK
jgi:UDP-N-acetylmuramate: L-alanyl-gamma-D-glutamyl-meso-diaminopimelate ligase